MPHVPLALLAPLSDSVYSGLLGLMAASSEDTLNLVLECMLPLVKVRPAVRCGTGLGGAVHPHWLAGAADLRLPADVDQAQSASLGTPVG